MTAAAELFELRRIVMEDAAGLSFKDGRLRIEGEGLHKARSTHCAGRQWAIAAALGDERFRPLARTTYELWAGNVLGRSDEAGERTVTSFAFEPLNDGLRMGVRNVPQAEPFVPARGCRAVEDISAVFVHEPGLDVAMSLLSGYSAFAEADCGNVKLFALTPELTAEPTYRNAGVDSLRQDWRSASEQIECSTAGGRSVLSGVVYTKWDNGKDKDFTRVHNRRIEVTMTYENGELVLEYETKENHQTEPVPSRLLVLLIALPAATEPRLQVGELDVKTPPAECDEEFFIKAAVDTVRFSAADGSTIEIVPEVSLAECITAQRPPRRNVSQPSGRRRLQATIKPANEGSLRVCFDGPNVLDRGRYRIRFRPKR